MLPLVGCAELQTQGATPPTAKAKPASIPVPQLLRRPGAITRTTVRTAAAGRSGHDRRRPAQARAPQPPRQRSYVVFGKDMPEKEFSAHSKAPRGTQVSRPATWSGEIYDMYAMSAAHPTLPIPSHARVTNLRQIRGGAHQRPRTVFLRPHDGPVLRRGLQARLADSGIARWKLKASCWTQWRRAERAPAAAEAKHPGQRRSPVSTCSWARSRRARTPRASAPAFANNSSWLKPAIRVQERGKLFRLHLGPYPARRGQSDLRQIRENSIQAARRLKVGWEPGAGWYNCRFAPPS